MKSTGIVDRLNCFVNSLPTKSYDRPAKKFVREILAGMMISKSTILTNIVRSLSADNEDFKANYKRINRRLGEVDLTVGYEEQQRRAFRFFCLQRIATSMERRAKTCKSHALSSLQP
jgi:hypothetical protein